MKIMGIKQRRKALDQKAGTFDGRTAPSSPAPYTVEHFAQTYESKGGTSAVLRVSLLVQSELACIVTEFANRCINRGFNIGP